MKLPLVAVAATALTLLPSLLAAEPPAHRAGIVLEEFVYTEAEFPQCHASTLIELANGDLLCAFFGGPKESHPEVEIRLSRKPLGGSWTAPVSVADGLRGDAPRHATGNPILFQAEGGDLILFYKILRVDDHWLGEWKTSRDGGRTWSPAHQMADQFIGPDKNKPVQLADGSILAGSAIEDEHGWRTHVERSEDNGKTWTRSAPLNDGKTIKAIQATILTHTDGRIQMLMRNGRSDADTKILETWSNDGGKTWSAFTDSNLPNNNSGLDGVTLADGRHLLVYNHSTRLEPGKGHKGRGVLNVAVSRDGVNWEAALVLDYIDEPGRQFSYPSVIQSDNGLVHIAYTWHRRRVKHVVIDPAELITYPIKNGHWPVERIPLQPVGETSTAELAESGLDVAL